VSVHVVSWVSVNSTFQNKNFYTETKQKFLHRKKKVFRNNGVTDWTKCQTVGWTPLKFCVKSYEICSVLETSKGYTAVVTCHIKGKVKWTVISCNSAKI